MPNRVIRDGLLESEAVLSLPPEGRWLYVSILLSADDYGLFEATTFKLAKRADIKREHVTALLQSMADLDLVRLYKPDPRGIRTFGFVTKFDQRLRTSRAKYPLPPLSLVADEDNDFLSKFKDLATRSVSDSRTNVSDRRPEAEAEAEAEAELNTNTDPTSPSGTPGRVDAAVATPTRKRSTPACPTDEIVALWHELCAPPLATVGVLNEARRSALSTRWREVCADAAFDRAQGIDWFRWFFAERVRTSDFLMGRIPKRYGKPWRCSWDWLMRPTNFAKAVDGNYADRREAS